MTLQKEAGFTSGSLSMNKCSESADISFRGETRRYSTIKATSRSIIIICIQYCILCIQYCILCIQYTVLHTVYSIVLYTVYRVLVVLYYGQRRHKRHTEILPSVKRHAQPSAALRTARSPIPDCCVLRDDRLAL